MTVQTVEKIQTGLTANYVPYWGVVQGLKEAMQNIAYGSIKAEKQAKLYFDTTENMWAIKDQYKGFEKRHLYIGESEQREDEDGLGTFGEGWKIFLLVMARNGIRHKVATTGFTFWGTLEPTPHGTEVLTINVEENEQAKGTKVYADVAEEEWRKATESFLILQGYDTEIIKNNCIIPGRNGELWVNGVRIENDKEENTNPLNLYYSYNLCQRDLINRDRSHVNTELAYQKIKQVVFQMSEVEIEDFVLMAINGCQHEDVLRGPDIPMGSSEQKQLWINNLAFVHATDYNKLIIPSYNQAVNDEAKRQGYVLLDTPRRWDFELSYLGIPKADDIVDDRYNVVEESTHVITKEDKSELSKAKTKMKKAFKLSATSQLPPFQYVAEIKNFKTEAEKKAYYDPELNVVFIATDIMSNQKDIVKALIPELIVWKYAPITSTEYEEAYCKVIENLLF